VSTPGVVYAEPTPVHLRPWLVIRTKPHKEEIAANHLRGADIECYCPMYLPPEWNRKRRLRPQPLFPGYLFARCRTRQEFATLKFSPGVAGPLMFDGWLARVSNDVIEDIRYREGDRGYTVSDEDELKIDDGSAVEVKTGPFTGLRGVFSGYLRGGERCRVLLELIRGHQKVEMDSRSVAIVRR
jgi:transcriptional antiterminator RfaH